MNLIKKVLLLAGIIYGVLFIIELAEGHILWQGLVGIGILIFFSCLPEVKKEHSLHKGEMIVIWTCILLFGIYAILKSGGFV